MNNYNYLFINFKKKQSYENLLNSSKETFRITKFNNYYSNINLSGNITFGVNKNLIIEKKYDNLTFINDNISSIPIFYYNHEDLIIISSHLYKIIDILKLFNIKINLNINSCSEMMLSSYIFTRGSTLIDKIYRLKPNHQLILNTKNCTIDKKRIKSDFYYDNKNILSWNDAKDNFSDNIISGLGKYREKKVGIMLSGGADSRIIATLASKTKNLNYEFITFGQSYVNNSDFKIALNLSKYFNKNIKLFTTSSLNFKNNWMKFSKKSNWTDMWHLFRLPDEFFDQLSEYDVILRGDGDGIYGWKNLAVDLSDILHLLEISPIESLIKDATWFVDPQKVFSGGQYSREKIIEKYDHKKNNLTALKNIMYQKFREYGCIAPNLWFLSNWGYFDAPLLWSQNVNLAQKLPENKRIDKALIFDTLSKHNINIPYSSGPSWDDNLENWSIGLTRELIEYSFQWSPWEINIDNALNSLNKPSSFENKKNNTFKFLNNSSIARNYVSKFNRSIYNNSFSKRGLIRLSIISNLNEYISK